MVAPGALPADASASTSPSSTAWRPPPAERSGRPALPEPARRRARRSKVGKPLEEFGFDTWDAKHPILRFTALGDIQVAAGTRARARAGRQGRRRERRRARSWSAARATGMRFVALGFDPRDSDFVLRVAWPLFVLNTINDFVEEDTSYISSFRTGEVWRIPAPGGAPSGELVDARRRERARAGQGRARGVPRRSRRASTSSRAVPDGAAAEREFAANLSDLEESTHRAAPRARSPGASRRRRRGVSRSASARDLDLLLLAAIAALSPSSGSPTTGGSRYERARCAASALGRAAIVARRLLALVRRSTSATCSVRAASRRSTWTRDGIDYELLDAARCSACCCSRRCLLFVLGALARRSALAAAHALAAVPARRSSALHRARRSSRLARSDDDATQVCTVCWSTSPTR